MIESKLKAKNANSGQLFKAFHFNVVSALQFIVFVFYFWLIRAVSSSYVHQQHFRPRSLAFICHFQNLVHEIVQKNGPKNSPMVQGSNGPVHILPYAE